MGLINTYVEETGRVWLDVESAPLLESLSEKGFRRFKHMGKVYFRVGRLRKQGFY